MKSKQKFQKVKQTPVSEQESPGVLSDTHRVGTSLIAQDCPQRITYYMDFPFLCGGVVSTSHKDLGALVHSLLSAGSVICYQHLSLVLSFEKGKKQKVDSAPSSCCAFVQVQNNCVGPFLQPGHTTLSQQLGL